MIKLKRITLTLVLSIGTLFVLGETTAEISVPTESAGDINFVTPQTAAFMTYGQTPVSLYTGSLNLSIPLYTIQDPDFNIPISLVYNSEAFKPLKPVGNVGYNWFLSAGGCITRQVQGHIADDVEGYQNEFTVKGFFAYSSQIQLDKELVYNFSNTIGMVDPTTSTFRIGRIEDVDVDYTPDVFSFNFNGHSGQFVIDNAGKPQLISDEYFKIDLASMAIQNLKEDFKPYESLYSSVIIMTDLAGYTYYFGGNQKALEYSVGVKFDSSKNIFGNPLGYEQLTPSISAWHLTKIVAPNGRAVQFYYKEANLNNVSDPLWQYQEYMTTVTKVTSNGGNASGSEPITAHGRQVVKSVVLDYISVSGENANMEVHLHHSQETSKIYSINSALLSNLNYQLDSISVHFGDTRLGSCVLDYDYLVTNGNNETYGRRFLKQVTDMKQGVYALSYTHPSSGYPIAVQLTESQLDQDGVYIAAPLIGLVKSITYPTGGRSEFTFEKPWYGKERLVTLEGRNIRLKTSECTPKEVLGARIRETRMYDGLGLVETTFYNYTDRLDYTGTPTVSTNHNPDSTETSGDKIDPSDPTQLNPNFGGKSVSNVVKSTGIYQRNRMKASNDLYKEEGYDNSFTIPESKIAYSSVTTITTNARTGEKHYTRHQFSSYATVRDDLGIHYSNNSFDVYDQFLSSLDKGLAFNSMSYRRGQLQIKEEYNSQKSIISRTTYLRDSLLLPFQTIVDDCGPLVSDAVLSPFCIVYLSQGDGVTMAKKIYYKPCPVEQIIQTKYIIDSESTISSVTNYKYDQRFRVKEKSVLNSDSKPFFERYRYADDVLSENVLYDDQDAYTSGCAALTNYHLLGSPIESINGYSQNGQEYVTGGNLLLYTTVGDKPVLSRSLSLSLSTPLEDFDSVRIENNRLVYSPLYVPTADYTFNSKLRLTSVQPYGLLKTSYIWDPNNLYPTSQTTGDQTVTYNYKPFVGMQSQTDARGITTYYSYDAFGRLVEVYQLNGGKKEILNAYSYNYAH